MGHMNINSKSNGENHSEKGHSIKKSFGLKTGQDFCFSDYGPW